MSTLITSERLKELLSEGVIQNGCEDCVEGIKYDLRFSGRFLKAKHGRAVDVGDFQASDSESIRVEPGETVFVLSEEILNLPNNIKVELSHKRKLAHLGVQILGGFCVDPLYHGRLIFGIHNYSSEPFPLIKGRKIIAIQFYRLSEEECGDFPVPQGQIDDFPRDVVGIIGRFKGISNEALGKKVEELNTLMRSLRDDFDRREESLGRLEQMVEKVMISVKELGDNLDKEREERRTGQDGLTKLTKGISEQTLQIEKQVERHGFMLKFMSVIVGGVVAVILGYYAIQLLGGS